MIAVVRGGFVSPNGLFLDFINLFLVIFTTKPRMKQICNKHILYDSIEPEKLCRSDSVCSL